MLFNSLDFAIFLPIVFILYWFVFNRNLKHQNLLVVIASFVFYGWWDWRFLFLILFSIITDYFIGLSLKDLNDEKKRKSILWISIIVNLGFLGFFKYYNFFIDSFIDAFSLFGVKLTAGHLNIILPVGISFYTFQTLSYTIDVYKRKLEPTQDFIAFAAFVSFFPQLVAGPIERATNLLPQFYVDRKFDYDKAVDGMRQILWGLFKKMVIADNCAIYVNDIFANYELRSGSDLALGALFFTFQIYGDFSGYSDIAIGTARLFGINLQRNFAFPYFSRNIAEFWRRWHISLSTWFKDYLYIPLGGSRGGNWMRIRNTFIIFLVSGFWHGANWTFIVWGALNALFIMPSIIMKTNRKNIEIVAQGKLIPTIKELFQITLTFSLTVLCWIFFRAETVGDAWKYSIGIFDNSLFSFPTLNKNGFGVLFLISFLLIIEWIGRENQYGIQRLFLKGPRIIRWSFYGFIILLIGLFMQTHETPFIYFQF